MASNRKLAWNLVELKAKSTDVNNFFSINLDRLGITTIYCTTSCISLLTAVPFKGKLSFFLRGIIMVNNTILLNEFHVQGESTFYNKKDRVRISSNLFHFNF